MKQVLVLAALALPLSSFACDDHEGKSNSSAKTTSNKTLPAVDQKILADFNSYKTTISPEVLKELDNFYKEKSVRREQDKESYKKLSDSAKEAIKAIGKLREKATSHTTKKQINLTQKS